MLELSAAVHKKKGISDQKIERLFFLHPYIGMFICCVVMPTLVLAAVAMVTCMIILPVAFIMGWL